MQNEASIASRFRLGDPRINRNGVPKGTIRIDIIIKRLLSQKEDEWPNEKEATAGEKLAMAAIRNGSVEAAYFKEVLNRNDGPVREEVHHTVGDALDDWNLSALDDQELELLEQLREKCTTAPPDDTGREGEKTPGGVHRSDPELQASQVAEREPLPIAGEMQDGERSTSSDT